MGFCVNDQFQLNCIGTRLSFWYDFSNSFSIFDLYVKQKHNKVLYYKSIFMI